MVALLTQIIEYVTNNTIDVIVAIVGGVISSTIFLFLIISFSPIFETVRKLRTGWINYRANPMLNLTITVGGEMDNIHQSEIIVRVNDMLKHVIGRNVPSDRNGIFRFKQSFNHFSVDVEIIPLMMSDSGLFSENESIELINFNRMTINVRTTDLKLKQLKNGLLIIQNFLFKDIFVDALKSLNFVPDIDNEGIKVKFVELPKMLDSIKDLNVDHLEAKDDDLKFYLNKDSINAVGNLKDYSIDKIVKVVKGNILS